jgi:hypothetical protein
MKNKIIMVVVTVFFTAMAIVGIAASNAGNTGAVWTVDSNGNKIDYFNVGTEVYIEGSNLAHDAPYTWTITDQDSSGSQKPPVAEGTGKTDSTGAIARFNSGWSVPLNDYPNHDYRLNVNIYKDTNQDDFYTKRDTIETQIPEFPTIALPVASAIGLIFMFSRGNK